MAHATGLPPLWLAFAAVPFHRERRAVVTVLAVVAAHVVWLLLVLLPAIAIARCFA